MMPMPNRLNISCLCGRASQQVTIRGSNDEQLRESWQASQRLCHCHACRHATGLLCTSFLPITPVSPNSLHSLVAYSPTARSTSYFCGTCGCHVFVCSKPASTPSGRHEATAENQWAVATGTITGSLESGEGEPGLLQEELVPGWDWQHDKVSETLDGGISIWINNKTKPRDRTDSQSTAIAPKISDAVLPASCHCGTVRFDITRPDATSRIPKSPFPDLMVPYCSTETSIVKNPSDEKWWLRGPDGTKYLAGTCACRSCRLASGFEIQTWAFIPRSNILIYPTIPSSDGSTEPQKLDFATISRTVLKSYESSPGIVREFCPRCGATVFWHDKERSELIDISVGLLEAPEGARAERWLEWWTGRVSFAEESGAARGLGIPCKRAKALVQGLQDGLCLGDQVPSR